VVEVVKLALTAVKMRPERRGVLGGRIAAEGKSEVYASKTVSLQKKLVGL